MARPKTFIAALLIGMIVAPVAFPTATASHDEYDQPVWFNWDKKQLDVLVFSGNDVLIGRAIEMAIEAWEVGIPQYSPSLGLELRVYWPSKDPVPPLDFQADIVVAPQGFFAVLPPLGGSLGTPTCYAFAPMMVGWGTLYSVTSHEFGHCLGLGHVFEHGVEYDPSFDIMGSGTGGKACPSNLNVQVLERVFSGQGGTVSISASAYEQSTC